MDFIQSLTYQFRWYDLLDILLVTSILVWLYSWVRGTRAFRVLLGLAFVVIIYLWARAWGLFLTESVLQSVVQVLIIFVIIIFAPEIRQVLERLNPLRIWNRPEEGEAGDYVDEIIEAVSYLANHATGALIVLERSDRLDELMRPGVPFNGEIRHETLISVFQPTAPTHDGAVWIRNGAVRQVGVFLPISSGDHPKQYGSRHRAALGLTEESDALVLLVSEERSEISLAEDGQLDHVTDLERLSERLRSELSPAPLTAPSARDLILRDWRVKLVSFALVTIVWFAVAGQQELQEEFSVPVETYNIPDQYRIDPLPLSEVQVTLKGTRLALARLEQEKLKVRVNLSDITPETDSVPLSARMLSTPFNVEVARIDPQAINIEVYPIQE